MKAQNIPEFIALIKRYESIKLEEIANNWEGIIYPGAATANKLTGFGMKSTCTLCVRVKDVCYECVYAVDLGCNSLDHNISYFNILESQTQEELLTAFRNRAKAMREFAKTKGIEIDETETT